MFEKKYTVEDIENLKKKNPEELTPEERRIRNLTPIKEGEIKNPKGRTKGCANWSTHFKRLMGNEIFLETIISSLPQEWQGIVEGVPADVIAAALIATITREAAKSVAEQKPISGSTLKAIQLLNKISYGDKIQVEPDENSFFKKPVINFVVREDRKKETENDKVPDM